MLLTVLATHVCAQNTLAQSNVAQADSVQNSAARLHLLPEYRFLITDDNITDDNITDSNITNSSATALQSLLDASSAWQTGTGQGINHGYQPRPLWLRFDAQVQGDQPLPALFEIGSSFLDQVDFYLVEWRAGKAFILSQQRGGDHRDFASRLQQHRYPLFEAAFPREGEYSLFVRVHSTSALMFQATLSEHDAFFHGEIRGQAFYGSYFGVILVLVYFNLMLMIHLRERTFLHNLFFLISIGVYLAALSGFGYSYLWHGNITVNDHVLSASACASFFFGGMFAIQFMELKTRSTLFYRLGNVLMAGFCVPFLLIPFLSEQAVVGMLQVLALVTAVFAFIVVGHQVIQRNPWAMYLLLGWSSTIGGYCIFVMTMLDWLPMSNTVLYLQAAGLGLGNVLVTSAIAARVRRERAEKTTALSEALDLSQEVARLTREKEQIENTANLQLQQEVEQKTRELNDMLESLQNSNQRLERDSQSDSLTGVHNRRYLDAVFPGTIAQCIRHHSSLGVLVIDADHFKRINDNFGHLAGDEALRKLATILQRYCRRNLDILVRYGGEEFVMLLPATDLDGVFKVAESIRHHVQYAEFWFREQKVPLTVSLGVHVGIPPIHATPESLMHKADEALYRAKENGRNRIEIYQSQPEEAAQA